VFAGCIAAVRGYPDPPRQSTAVPPDPDYLLGHAAIKAYHTETDLEKKKVLRNEIIDARLDELDRKFGEFERDLHIQGVGFGIGTDWLLLAVAGATATVGGASVKAALGAVSAGIVGARVSFDKQALFDRTLPALMAQMVAQRETIRATVRRSQDLPVESYTIYAALSDLQRFEQASSIPGALQAIAEDAGQKATAARAELKDIRTAKFMKTTAGDLLRKFWKPDGVAIDKQNEQRLMKWMTDNGIATGPGAITMFLRSDVLEEARIKAVRELNLMNSQ
jgi:hypothetical protein